MNNIVIGIPHEIVDYQKIIPLIPRDIKLLINNLKINIYMHSKIFENSFYSKDEYSNIGVNIINDTDELYNKCNFIIKINELHESEYYLVNSKHTIICFTNTDKFINYCVKNYVNIISYNEINNNIINKLYQINIQKLLNEFDYYNSDILVIDDNEHAKYFIETFEKLQLNYKVCSKYNNKYLEFNNRNLKKLLFNSNIIINFTSINQKLLDYMNIDNLYIKYDNNYNDEDYYKLIRTNNYNTYLINNKFFNKYPKVISNLFSELLYNYIDYNVRNNTVFNYTLYNGIIVNKIHKDFII